MEVNELLKRMPLLRLLLPFAAGILIQNKVLLPLSSILPVCGALFFLLLFVTTFPFCLPGYNLRWIYGIALNSLIIFISMWAVSARTGSQTFTDHTGSGGVLIARVYDTPSERERSFRVVIEPVSVLQGDIFVRTSGRAVAWFEKDSLSAMLRPGDRIVLPNSFRPIENSGNPFEFDFKRYMGFRGIVAESYVPGDKWLVDGSLKGRGVVRVSAALRDRLYNILKNGGIDGDELAVAGALLMGLRSGIDSDLRQTYGFSGAMHILAVSGLHVGILCFFLQWVFRFFRRFRYYKVYSTSIIIFAIWFYAMLTGLSPSVTRAATMFSFVFVGRSLSRYSDIFNTLAASALFQLMIDPFTIYMTGFQLSYLAVSGIAVYQAPLSSLLRSGNFLIRRIWTLITVSVSAQILIFPLLLHNFNYFPNYFVLTNMFAVPFAVVILCSGLLLFIFSFVPVVSAILAYVLNFALTALNFLVRIVSLLPLSVSGDIFLSIPATLILYCLIISVSLFFFFKRVWFLKIGLVFIIAGLFLAASRTIRTSGQQFFIVYNCSGYSAYNFITDRENILVKAGGEKENDGFPDHVAQKPALYLNTGDIKKVEAEVFFNPCNRRSFHNLHVFGSWVDFGGYRIFFARGQHHDSFNNPIPPDTDLIVISSDYRGRIDNLYRFVKPGMVVIDSSVGYYRRQQLIDECLETGIEFHDMRAAGAFYIEITSMQ